MADGDLSEITVTRSDAGVSTYTTIDGDTLGNICCRYYGYEWDTTEAVYAANPGLARLSAVFEAGVVITLPVVEKSASTTVVNLFD